MKGGYSGKYYFVVDDEDPSLQKYQERFGNKVLIFNKDKVAERVDLGDNFNNKKVINYARNVCYDLAKQVGVTEFLELDDDYNAFRYRFTDTLDYCSDTKAVKSLDKLFCLLLSFYKANPISVLAIAQGGDFIGGSTSGFSKEISLYRKAMNTLICSVNRPVTFVGRINEDVNTYVLAGIKGELFFTLNQVDIRQLTTQANSGGMTETYKDSGTYVKSFYSVIYAPSCVKITEMGVAHRRLHHKINWSKCATKILSEQYKR